MNKEPETRTTPFDGKEALIVGDHPHAGESATCLRAEYTPIGWGLVFKGEHESFFVFEPEFLKWT